MKQHFPRPEFRRGDIVLCEGRLAVVFSDAVHSAIRLVWFVKDDGCQLSSAWADEFERPSSLEFEAALIGEMSRC